MRAIAFCAALLPAMAWAGKPAMTPEALWMAPLPDACVKHQVVAKLVVRARDEGRSEAEAIERATALLPLFAGQARAFAPGIYRHKELTEEDVDRYVMFSCHAQSYKLPALGLDEVAPELRACGAKFGRDECVVELRNVITGAPRAYRPGSRMAPPPARP